MCAVPSMAVFFCSSLFHASLLLLFTISTTNYIVIILYKCMAMCSDQLYGHPQVVRSP